MDLTEKEKLPVSEKELVERAELMRQKKDDIELSNTKILMINVALLPEFYGLQMKYIEEIIKPRQITKIPFTPDYITGIVNYSGRPLLVSDIRILFGLEPVKFNDDTKIIVIKKGEYLTGVLVDRILEIIDIAVETFSLKSLNLPGIKNDFITGAREWDGKHLILLNIDNIMNYIEEQLKHIKF